MKSDVENSNCLPPFKHPDADEAYRWAHSLWTFEKEVYLRLTDGDRMLHDVVRFEAEVMNGGVDQFLYHSSGDHALETPAALREIDANESFEYLAAACSLFPNGRPSKDCETRREQLDAVRPEDPALTLNDVVAGDIEHDLHGRLFAFLRREEEVEQASASDDEPPSI
jgi:hypothetical protein